MLGGGGGLGTGVVTSGSKLTVVAGVAAGVTSVAAAGVAGSVNSAVDVDVDVAASSAREGNGRRYTNALLVVKTALW